MRCSFTSCTTITSRFQLEEGPLSAWTEKTAYISQRHHWFPREMTFEQRLQNSIQMTRHYPHVGGAFDWLKQIFNQSDSLPRSGSRHQYGISAFVSQTPFCGENNCGVAKCRLVSAAALSVTLSSQSHYWIIYAISLKFIPFTNFKNRSNAT